MITCPRCFGRKIIPIHQTGMGYLRTDFIKCYRCKGTGSVLSVVPDEKLILGKLSLAMPSSKSVTDNSVPKGAVDKGE
jgi:hypothetical protein